VGARNRPAPLPVTFAVRSRTNLSSLASFLVMSQVVVLYLAPDESNPQAAAGYAEFAQYLSSINRVRSSAPPLRGPAFLQPRLLMTKRTCRLVSSNPPTPTSRYTSCPCASSSARCSATRTSSQTASLHWCRRLRWCQPPSRQQVCRCRIPSGCWMPPSGLPRPF